MGVITTRIVNDAVIWMGQGYPLDAYRTGLTGAWSMSRLLVSFHGDALYADTAGTIDSFNDQVGPGHFDDIASPGAFPSVAVAGPNNKTCVRMAGEDQHLVMHQHLDKIISATEGYVVASGILRAINTNDAIPQNNDSIFGDRGGYMGLFFKNGGGSTYTAHSYSWDGDWKETAGVSIALDVPYVFEWRTSGGQLYVRVNGSTEQQVATGALEAGWENEELGLGHVGSFSTEIDIFEMASWNVVPDLTARNAIVANMKNWIVA